MCWLGRGLFFKVFGPIVRRAGCSQVDRGAGHLRCVSMHLACTHCPPHTLTHLTPARVMVSNQSALAPPHNLDPTRQN